MDNDWKDWNVVETIEGLHVPRFLSGEWETTDEYLEQTKDRVAEHWNQFRAMLTTDNESEFEAQGSGYSALCKLRERMDSQHEKIQEQLEHWEFESTLRKLVILGFRKKVRDLSLERARDDDDSEPSDEQFKSAWEKVIDRPMGEAWLSEDLDFPSLVETGTSDGWQVNPVFTRFMPEEDLESKMVQGPTLSDLTIRYLPHESDLERAGVDPDSVSSRDVRSFDGDTTWDDALQELGEHHEVYEKQREQHDRTLKAIEFRRRILKNVLHQFEAYGSVEKKREEDQSNENALVFDYARAVVKFFDEKEELFESRRALLSKVVEGKGVPGENAVDHVQYHLENEDLYPKRNAVGRPPKSEQQSLLTEMVDRCRDFLGENGKTEQNGN